MKNDSQSKIESEDITKKALILVSLLLLILVSCLLLPFKGYAQLNPSSDFDSSIYYAEDAVDYESLTDTINALNITSSSENILLSILYESEYAFNNGNVNGAINLLNLLLFQTESMYIAGDGGLSESDIEVLALEKDALIEDIKEVIKVPYIEYPESGATIKGMIPVSAMILSQDIYSSRFEYSNNGINWFGIGNDYNGSDGWSVNWNTMLLEDGIYFVQVTTIDNEGTARVSEAVEVIIQQKEKVPPVLICPGDMNVSATDKLTSVTYSVSVTDNEDPHPQVSFNYPSGFQFPLGETIVTVTAEDDSGNSSQCSFTITVSDDTPPHLICPADRESIAQMDEMQIASFLNEASATDTIDGVLEVSNNAPSFFPAGSRTLITFSATDSAGNTNQCETMVSITPFDTASGMYNDLINNLESSTFAQQNAQDSLLRTLNESFDAFLEGNPTKASNLLNIFTFHLQSLALAGEGFSESQMSVVDSLTNTIREQITQEGPSPVPLITYPADGDTVKGGVIITLTTVSSDVQYAQFEYTSDGDTWILIGRDIFSLDGWSFTWDTKAVTDGSYFIRGCIGDLDERQGCDFVNVFVHNAPDILCNGDINGDGMISPSDALEVFKCYLKGGTCGDCYDVNNDGVVAPSDALCLFRKYLKMPSCLD
ncbi:MAG: HYR domain-containing protein [bacterium]